MTIRNKSARVRLRGWVFLASALAGLGLLLSACGSLSSIGTINGRLLAYGGASVSLKGRPLEGHIKATNSRGTSFVTSVPKDGNFVFQVPTGTYSLAGSSPQFGVACTSA